MEEGKWYCYRKMGDTIYHYIFTNSEGEQRYNLTLDKITSLEEEVRQNLEENLINGKVENYFVYKWEKYNIS